MMIVNKVQRRWRRAVSGGAGMSRPLGESFPRAPAQLIYKSHTAAFEQ